MLSETEGALSHSEKDRSDKGCSVVSVVRQTVVVDRSGGGRDRTQEGEEGGIVYQTSFPVEGLLRILTTSKGG